MEKIDIFFTFKNKLSDRKVKNNILEEKSAINHSFYQLLTAISLVNQDACLYNQNKIIILFFS